MYQETMQALFDQAFLKYRDNIALKFKDQVFSYDQIRRIANRCSHSLIERGIHPGMRVALLLSNCPEFIISDLAIMKTGATKVPLNDMLGKKEITYILRDSGAKVAFVGQEFFSVIQDIRNDLPDLEWFVGMVEEGKCPDGFIPWETFLAGASEADPEPRAMPEDPYLLAYTGGTTGLPKGVVHNQRNGYINICSHVIETGIGENERMLFMTPLPHSAGLFTQAGLLRGATVIIEAKFDPIRALTLIEQEKITFTFMVPTMIYRVLDQLRQAKYDTSSLHTIIYGAAPITAERLKQGLAVFGNVFVQFFGQTECPNFITRLSKHDHTLEPDKIHRLRSCGRPVMMARVRIVNEEGQEVPRGEVGEIVCSAPYVMNEYYKLPDKTAETVRDGWLYTGDIGKMDEDGYVYLLDRKKDMIISGGMNVYTTEVENALQKHPKVRQVAVIGVPHNEWGEAVLALIIPADDSLTEEELLDFAKENLSSYKRPKKIEFVTEFPLTPYGKLDKKELRKPYWEQAGRQVN
jgi:fatty-acyl-CoA synthase/long-chain acyl-CoA synthetase